MNDDGSSVTATYLLAHVAPAVVLTINVTSDPCEIGKRADDEIGKETPTKQRNT